MFEGTRIRVSERQNPDPFLVPLKYGWLTYFTQYTVVGPLNTRDTIREARDARASIFNGIMILNGVLTYGFVLYYLLGPTGERLQTTAQTYSETDNVCKYGWMMNWQIRKIEEMDGKKIVFYFLLY